MSNNNLTDERLSALIRVARDSLELYEMELPVIDDVMLALAELQQRRAAMLQAGNSPVTPVCWCSTCRPVTMNDMRFVVCPECGNKRCPRASDHNNACTGSNDPGQVSSAYPAAPQQEVKAALEHGMQRYAGAMQKLSEGDK